MNTRESKRTIHRPRLWWPQGNRDMPAVQAARGYKPDLQHYSFFAIGGADTHFHVAITFERDADADPSSRAAH